MSIVEAVLQTLSALKFETTSADSSETQMPNVEAESLETAEKLRVFQSLPTIAKSMGVEDTQKVLIPMLNDLVQKAINAGDDEVLMVISQKLLELGQILKSEGEGASSLIPIISDVLVLVEEVVVAQAAADAFCALLPLFSSEQIEKKALPLIRKLHEEDLFCASRKVVSKMIVSCYPYIGSKLQSEMKYRLIHLADNEEEVPLVRSAAILQLVQLINYVGVDIKAELAPILTGLVCDSQRIVRAACVAPLLELGRLLAAPEAGTVTEFETIIHPCLDKLAEDGSRDTRRALSFNMAELQKVAVTKGGATRSLHQMMMNLLEDNEVETRRVAACQLKDFCLASPTEVLVDFLLPRLQEHLNMEREERVRSELVCCAVGLLPHVRNENCLPLVRPILAFLNLNMDQPKQYVFEHFAELMALIPASEIQLTILPSLVNLWQVKNWRVRLGVVQSLPVIFGKLPEACLRETLLPSTLAWLRDPTWAVRDCACRSLARLLRACPSAAKDAIMGTNPSAPPVTASSTPSNSTAMFGSIDTAKTTTSSSTTAGSAASGPGSNASLSATSSSVPTTGTAGSLGGSGADALSSSMTVTGGDSIVTGGVPIATLTATAAARGLQSLATDPNYHLRQIFILAVQALWGPGIPDEPIYSALGDVFPNVGLNSPTSVNLYEFVSNHSGGTKNKAGNSTSKNSNSSASLPPKCSPCPTMPSATLQTCLTALLHLLSDDPVPNVRFAAARALLIISNNIEKKLAQKQLVPALKKSLETDKDFDVRYFAQEALIVLASV